MSKRVLKEYREVSIKKKEFLNDCYFILETEAVDIFPQPGQFYLLKPKKNFASILHIPVSIYDIVDSKLQFLIKVVGEGTKSLSALTEGDKLNILGPLGNGFSLVDNKKVLLISGGIGYAPLYLLKQQLSSLNNEIVWLHGGKSASDILPADLICTEDGKAGTQGLVTDELIKLLTKSESDDVLISTIDKANTFFDMIYCCGPEAMMREVTRILLPYNISLEVSLEEYMACGLGACLGCVVKTRSQNNQEEYLTVCKDGPIFQGNEVIWNE
ncbi:MAG: dihydroorotate dehydrogenase electron transfer subunit [Candidatus Cloacimonetes bacterium]|nr:dihydroorotate dehydrogenase electron transfer subunit [Candidatus Cloacimonadota bacterium]